MHEDLEEQVIQNAGVHSDIESQERRVSIVQNFRNAWEFSLKNYSGEIELPYLQDVVGKLEPELCGPKMGHSQFRDRSVLPMKLGGVSFTAPADRARVLEHLRRLREVLDKNSFHPVEEAALTNLHLVRIQPFEAANKRLANIVMNTILHTNGYFPLSLIGSNREAYLNYLGGAIKGFQNLSSVASDPLEAHTSIDISQSQFYEYLAQRELSELRFAEDRLKGLHNYKVYLDVKDKGSLFAAKKRISAWFYRQKSPSQNRLDTSRRQLEVIGDIPYSVLNEILGSMNGLKYKIEDNGRH
jgi:hypothetical protein